MVISATIEKNLPKNKAITMKSQSSILSSTEAEFVTCNWKTPNIKKMSMSYSEKIIIYRKLRMTGKEPE